MSRDLGLYLQDICDCIEKIKGYTENVDYQSLVQMLNNRNSAES